MSGLEIVPFSDKHVDAAAELLARRHARHLAVEPTLPDDVDFRAQLEGEWSVDGASGVFASRGGEPVGYLVARPVTSGGGITWMIAGIGGHAVEGDAELARDLYSAAAGRWVEGGHSKHAVFIPAHDTALIDAWFRLSFGASAVLAARETAAAPARDGDFEIRRGTPADQEAAALLDRAMGVSMVPAPSFSGVAIGDEQSYVDEWAGTWDEPQYEHFVAEQDGRVVGHILLYRRPHDLRVPKNSIDLAGASTFPEARGSGIGRALTEHVLGWAHENGIPTMVTDWRMTNMLASRFWPRRGFRPTFMRLYRALP
jgi:ribosomal protein S18 acetylase RimI-like enzyme